jgi:hypothetical protein
VIYVDTREQNGDHIIRRLTKMNIEAELMTFPQDTGCDYLITNTHGTCCIQRKVALPELTSELDEIMNDIVPRLISFGDNPSLLVEENCGIDESGYLTDRNSGRSSQMLATSYFGFLETIRKMGVDVYCTRDLNSSIYWMAAMHGYLAKHHYPKHRKYFSVEEQAVGALCCVPTIGEKRAVKALSGSSLGQMYRKKNVPGLTEKMNERLQKMLQWKGDA